MTNPNHPEAVALLVELISKNAIPTCQYVDEGYPEAALPDWRVTQTATAIVAAGFVLADATSLHHPTGERITRKDLNNAFRQGRENGRLAAEALDAEACAAIAAELADPAGGEIVQLAAELACEALPEGHIPMPRNADEAVAMWLLGERWVRDNAPERLRPAAPASGGMEAVGWVGDISLEYLKAGKEAKIHPMPFPHAVAVYTHPAPSETGASVGVKALEDIALSLESIDFVAAHCSSPSARRDIEKMTARIRAALEGRSDG